MAKPKKKTPQEELQTLLERMPWRGKFTTAETAVIEARRVRLVESMTDAVGIFGQVMYTDPSHLQLLAVHIAMAGDFFDDGHGQYIEARIRDVADDDGQVLFEGIREWRKCGEFGDEPAEPDDDREEREAAAALALIKEQLTPAVRRKLMRRITADFTATTQEEDPAE